MEELNKLLSMSKSKLRMNVGVITEHNNIFLNQDSLLR